MIRTTAVAAGAVLVLAACGGSDGDAGDATDTAGDDGQLVIVDTGGSAAGGDEDDELVIADGGAAETGDVVTSGADGGASVAGGGSEEELALAFAACMRDEGIDWPDPTFAADGSIDLLGGTGPGAGGGGDGAGQLFSDRDSLEDALAVCGPIVEGASFLPDRSEQFDEETQDQLLEFAQCLRDNGLDVDDPDLDEFTQPGGGRGGLFGEGFDPQDPASQDALDACQELFIGGGRGPLGGGGN